MKGPTLKSRDEIAVMDRANRIVVEILEMMREHELSEFELERDNFKLRVRKSTAGHFTGSMPMAGHAPAYAPQMPLDVTVVDGEITNAHFDNPNDPHDVSPREVQPTSDKFALRFRKPA